MDWLCFPVYLPVSLIRFGAGNYAYPKVLIAELLKLSPAPF